jgi:hypothetical protein
MIDERAESASAVTGNGVKSGVKRRARTPDGGVTIGVTLRELTEREIIN